jgi:hypothetical protein
MIVITETRYLSRVTSYVTEDRNSFLGRAKTTTSRISVAPTQPVIQWADKYVYTAAETSS